MNDVAVRTSPLNWKVFVAPPIPVVTYDLPPGVKQWLWSPISSTLIYGVRDAVLVDAFITIDQAERLTEWVGKQGRNLTTIYVTHGHGDHFFGIGTLLKHFPNAKAVATPESVKMMRQQASQAFLDSYWRPRFPGQIPDPLVIAEELAGNTIDLEGHELVVVLLGHTDTVGTTCLYVPSIGLVVAGDSVYNGVHLHLGESDAKQRQEWIAALDLIESLHPKAVIAGHKRPENDDDPKIIEETSQYIRDFGHAAETTDTARELYAKMLRLYPDRVNPAALWSSACGVKPRPPLT